MTIVKIHSIYLKPVYLQDLIDIKMQFLKMKTGITDVVKNHIINEN